MSLDSKEQLMRIGIDTQCVSYIISVMQEVSEPIDNLAPEKIALFRTYLYMPNTLYITPTVRKECSEISDIVKKEAHDSFFSTLFCTLYPEDILKVEQLKNNYLSFHNHENDCQILAEAQVVGINTVLSYDFKFISRLSKQSTHVRLLEPTKFWAEMSIPKGSRPNKKPHWSNPIGGHTWWQW